MPSWRDSALEGFLLQPELWVFAYGSLVWSPCFDFQRRELASLQGYSRALAIRSSRYRGTPKRPGLVFGLQPEVGPYTCQGVAFQLPLQNREAMVDALWSRELFDQVYVPKILQIQLVQAQTRVSALSFVIDSTSPACADSLSVPERLQVVAQASGERGSNAEYVLKTWEALQLEGIEDPELADFCRRLRSE